ncbi:hypothetical protein SRHO_G00151070 [Serrasalmus rhombeus]
MPKYDELPGFQGSEPLAQQRWEKMESYMFVQSIMAAPMPPLAEMCLKLISRISSLSTCERRVPPTKLPWPTLQPAASVTAGLVLESNSVLSARRSTRGIQTSDVLSVGVTCWVQRLFSVTAPQGHVCAERT